MNLPANSQNTAQLGQAKGPRMKIRMPDGKERIPLGSGIITGFLGEGGMANVYEIWNSQLEVSRAVKLINPNCSDDAKERFKTEIKICAKLHHPNIIEIYGVGKWNELPYIEMEKIDGITLDRKIKMCGALPPAVCTSVGIMIGRALKYAHNQQYVIYGNNYTGIIHRDLKPSNIMLNKNGSVKLMDFGIASPTEASFHTMEGTVLGTLQYLSPEQLEGRKLDSKTDIYSLGVSLYEIVCGRLAFPEGNVHKLMMDKLKSRFKPLEEYDIKVPARLRKFIYRAMQNDRKNRIPSAEALLAELDKIHQMIAGETPEKVMADFMSRNDNNRVIVSTIRRVPKRLIVSAVVVLAVGVMVQLSYKGIDTRVRSIMAQLKRGQTPLEQVTPVAVTPQVNKGAPEVARSQNKPVVQKVQKPLSKPAVSQPPPSAPAPTPAPAPEVRPKTLLDELALKYGVDDPLEIMSRELRAGNATVAIRLYEEGAESFKQSSRASLLMLRALSRGGTTAALALFVNENAIDDGEFYLAKARLAYEQGSVAQAQQLLNKSETLRRELLDYEAFKQGVGYYRALCATKLFDGAPDEVHYRDAIEKWYELRNLLRDNPQHRYHQTIVKETQRISQVFRSGRG